MIIIDRARLYGVPPWEYAARLSGLPVQVFTTPAAMLMWTDWGGIIRRVEQALSDPDYFKTTTETFG